MIFSQPAKQSSQNTGSGVSHNKYFHSTRQSTDFEYNFQNLCVFCQGKVNSEQLISHEISIEKVLELFRILFLLICDLILVFVYR